MGSPWMRTTYGIAKLVSFAGLAVTHALGAFASRGAVPGALVATARTAFLATSWISVVLCLVRGVPVILEALPSVSQEGDAEGAGDRVRPQSG